MLVLLRFGLFTGLLFLAFFLYAPGLDGGLYFDDEGNLAALGDSGGITNAATFWQYVLGNNSGPTGRPISMASFLINDNNWPPASVFSFKYANLLLHLLNGVLIFWLLWLLLKNQAYRFSLSLVVTAWWLLHPMQVSTTLYVIQRMTELATLFSLAGMIGYLYGRDMASRRPWVGFGLMSLAVSMFGLLAVFSKENGALLILYLLVIEFFWLRPTKQVPPRYFGRWALVFLYLPTLLLTLYLTYLAFSAFQHGFPGRDFSPAERFYTELGIAFDYLRKILLPPFAGWGIYSHYPVVSSFWQPLTLLAAFGWLTLLGLAFWLRRSRYWPLSFAIAWFIAGHLLETFAITGLEFAFWHRNYLAMLGPLLAVTYGVFYLRNKVKELVWLGFAGLLLYSLWVTAEQSKLWGDPIKLAVVWAAEQPQAARAQLEAYNVMRLLGDETQQDYYLERLYQAAPTSSGVILQIIQQQCRRGTLTPEALQHWQTTLATLSFDNFATNSSKGLYEIIIQGTCPMAWTDYIKLMAALAQQKNAVMYRGNPDFLAARAYVELRDLDGTMLHLEAAYEKDKNINIILHMVEVLASAGLYDLAIEKLNEAKATFAQALRFQKPETARFIEQRLQELQEKL
jgi:hypothetical protein